MDSTFRIDLSDQSFRGVSSLGRGATRVHAGASVGRYRLESPFERSVLGSVWSARDESGGAFVLRFVPESLALDRPGLAELKEEGERARRVTHAHLVPQRGLEVDGELAFLVSERVDGPTLSDVVEARVAASGRGLDAAEAVWVLQHAVPALEHAHAAGLLHRDVRPATLLVDGAAGGVPDAVGRAGQSVKLRDLATGFAAVVLLGRRTGAQAQESLQTMAPEVLLGRAATPAADVHALAATLWWLVTGRPPFAGADLIGQILHASAPPLQSGDAALDDAVAAGLAKDPTARPATPAELLRLAAGAEALAVMDPRRIEPRRSTWPWAVLVAVALAALATLALLAR